MRTKLTHALLTLGALAMFVTSALAADPGSPLRDASASDQKAGSILFYNAYSSSATAGNTTNTRINITNTNATNPIAVHLFFVDGSTCGIADSYICLTQNQTASFLASDIDPGVDGYILAVAVQGAKSSDLNPGEPIAFDWLIGDEYIKLASGHAASLGAYSIATNPTVAYTTAYTASGLGILRFGVGFAYNSLPRVVAVDNIPSRADGNDTLLIISRMNGNYATGQGRMGTIFGLMYDDAENVFSYSLGNPPACQYRASYSDNVPRTTPRFSQLVPAGRSAWTKFWAPAAQEIVIGGIFEDVAIMGSVINRNGNAATAANAFNGGHNLHVLTLSSTVGNMLIPVFPPNC